MTERLTKKQIEEYKALCSARDNGRLLTPTGLRFICEANNNDPEAIGKHFLEALTRFRVEKNYLTYEKRALWFIATVPDLYMHLI